MALFALLPSVQKAEAVPFTLPAIDAGSYSSEGSHQASNQNYVAGIFTSNPPPGNRNFFVFDATSIATSKNPLQTATLSIFNPNNGFRSFSSLNPSATFSLFNVTTSIADLTASNGVGIFGRDIHQDLGSGTLFGSKQVSSADNGQFVRIDLTTAAVREINDGIARGNAAFAIGGAVTEGNAVIFGNSSLGQGNVILSGFSAVSAPEPGTLLLVASGIVGLARWRLILLRTLRSACPLSQ
ncbi:MAG: PEP-CTERM sorting domain-containing protein [Nitrospira defluvii]|nr:PEP-CTERM sorting domain-containing protein [Nitrospira defluvii]